MNVNEYDEHSRYLEKTSSHQLSIIAIGHEAICTACKNHSQSR